MISVSVTSRLMRRLLLLARVARPRSRFGGVAGEREEHVVERRAAQREVVDADAGVARAAARPRRSRRVRSRTLDLDAGRPRDGAAARRTSARAPARRARRRRRRRGAPPGARRRARSLSSSEVPSAIRRPWSITAIVSARRSASSRYCVVSSDRRAFGDEPLDHLPQAQAAARIEAGRRLVEEQHRRLRRRAPRRGRAAGACRRSRSSRAGSAASTRSKRSSSSRPRAFAVRGSRRTGGRPSSGSRGP